MLRAQPGDASSRVARELVFERLDGSAGFGVANSVGVRRARRAAVVMLNPDTELSDGSSTRWPRRLSTTRIPM
jgi:hypothetical protein